MILKIVSLSPASLYAYGHPNTVFKGYKKFSLITSKLEPLEQKDATSWHVIKTTPDLDLHPLYSRIFKDYMIFLNSNLNLWIFIFYMILTHINFILPILHTVVVVHVV